MKKKKFTFLDLDSDSYVEKVSSNENIIKKQEEHEMLLAEKEALRIEKEVQRKKFEDEKKRLKEEQRIILEESLRKELEKIKKSEKEAKKIEEEHQLKNKVKEELLREDEKISKIQQAAEKLKKDYEFSKTINKEYLIEEKNLKIESLSTNLENLFPKKEKLEIKTNIYLRNDLYEKVLEIKNRTGKSRSAIINKMIEFALEKM